MNKAKIMALFIGILMLGSTAGFALLSPVSLYGGQQASTQTQDQQQISVVVMRPLTSQERTAILNAGRVIFEYRYPPGCAECLTEKGVLEAVATRFNGLLFVEEIIADERTAELVAPSGNITDLSTITITEDALMAHFCAAAIYKPRDCLLLQF